MNDFLDVYVEINNYEEKAREDYPIPKIRICSVFAHDEMVRIGNGEHDYVVKASELIKAAQLCSNNRW